MTALRLFLVSVLLLALSAMGSGQQDEVDAPPYPPSVCNPVNTITINACCNKTEQNDDLRQELQNIKELLNTIKTGLENGDYCCNGSTSRPRDCYEVQESGAHTSGVYTIYPVGTDPFDVYCDMDTDGGGWTVFQRRDDGSVDFYKYWADYETGFGPVTGEHWLGNDKLLYLINQKTYRLRVDLADFEEETRYAVYDSFVIAGASDNYRLSLGSYSGNAGDAMTYCNGQQFSTRDQDNDVWENDCANTYKGGWWYQSCHYANLNGLYLAGPHTTYADGVDWNQWKGYHYSLKFSEMKLRPV